MARLPKVVKPTHYDLDLNLDLEGLVFRGSVVIHLDVLADPVASIVLHAKDLEITSTKIEHPSGETAEITTSAIEANADQQTISIHLPPSLVLAAGSNALLHLSFHGTIKPHGRTPGFQWTGYKTADGQEKWAVSTECEPIGARCIFPCLDEPEYKATISSSITINDVDLTVVSNMDVASSQINPSPPNSEGRGSKTVRFNTTPRTSTYLICFVVGDFDFIESTQLRFPVRVYGVKGSTTKLQHGTHMLKVAVDALDRYEKLFGLPYPLPKLDLVALPDAGALENWGCIVFGERFILLDAETTAAKSWQMATETLCHEIAHQWFGNLVTMAWWDDLWLNEAFAEWAGFYVVDKMFPEWQYWLHFVAGDPDPEAMAFYQGALDLDSTRASHPIYNPDASPDRMGELFDNITYMKGASLLRMLCHHLGSDGFITGVKAYLQRHAYANATTSDLWEALTASTGEDVKELMHSWTKHIGHPILSVSEDEASGTITVEQHRYLQSVAVTPEEDENLFHVPLNMKTLSGGDQESKLASSPLLLTDRQQALSIPSRALSFYKLNAGQIGLYRVSYPPSRLQKFSDQLAIPNLLSAEDRVGLISDTHALISSALPTPLSTADLLSLLLSFHDAHEQNFLVWRQIFYTFAKLKQAFLFSSPQAETALQNLHRHLVLPLCRDRVWEISASDAVEVQNAKALFFSQAASYPPLSDITTELFDRFIAGDNKAFHPNIRKYVFQAVAQTKDTDRFDTLLILARTTPDPELRTDAFVSLGYSSDPQLIQQALALITAPGEPFNPLEKWFLLNALQTHKAGAEAAWAWLTGNWEEKLQGKAGAVTLQRYTASCTGSLSTREQLEDVKRFAGEEFDKFKKAFGQAIEGIEARMAWVERDGKGVEAWLEEHGFSSG
ncbi:aminopeptidase 2 [Echria macrotheca]|uniref:Aminopeptidase n=1 Tax=Echria macrotheca TaxID=438768 RepID=A0AAJ0B221_9PEZI|nr:aminopeptidase 2 [Echria macrotheca]